MHALIEKISTIPGNSNIMILTDNPENLPSHLISEEERNYISVQKRDNKILTFAFNRLTNWIFVCFIKDGKQLNKRLEEWRKAGDDAQKQLNKLKTDAVVVKPVDVTEGEALAFAEGMALGNYQFIKYFRDRVEKAHSLNKIRIDIEKIDEKKIARLNIIIEAVYQSRNLVNEPVMQLNATGLAKELEKLGKEAGIKTEVFTKKKIESLKMGGLLAVNKGSIDTPTFTVMEWKPENAVNSKPVILVGKGVVYDTGGLNIKTGNYMENMKSDMAGAAIMGATIYAAAQAKLPLHLIALIPATDNRLNGNAYASGDVVKMHNGMTVEIINTDAEGRMILADALSYAQRYDPELVINAATLTGSAERAIGKYGVVAMHTGAEKHMIALKESGNSVNERVAEFPFWDDYAELIKSEIADLKNVGPPEAGMITAGKFLEKFTNYPFIHLDIAGVAFAEKRDSYRNIGGTGFGVRLLFDFLEMLAVK
nr:leucyl aminopeptidase [Bacteroidota bacterium]